MRAGFSLQMTLTPSFRNPFNVAGREDQTPAALFAFVIDTARQSLKKPQADFSNPPSHSVRLPSPPPPMFPAGTSFKTSESAAVGGNIRGKQTARSASNSHQSAPG